MNTQIAREFLQFVNASPSPFHAVAYASSLLKQHGFKELSERNDDQWSSIQPNGKYFFTRNQSSLISFVVGGQYQPGNGFAICAAHTDSPVLKVKPISKVTKHGYLQVGVEPYGGGLWHTWFDRELSVAGRVIIKQNDQYYSKLVDIDKSLLRIPNLAIHLQREIYDKGFNPNKQTHMLPVVATQIAQQLTTVPSDCPADHHPLIYQHICKQLNCEVSDICDMELCVYDRQPGEIAGAYDEFVVSRALDNLLMSFLSVYALIHSDGVENEKVIRMAALFDNEEIGSQSAQGASSNLLSQLLSRLSTPAKFDVAMRKSFLVSADMAHAVHPNFAELHEENHRPAMHKGLVIKENCNIRYATNALTSFMINEIAKKHGIATQKFVIRNDMGCGSTVGPILSANCGIRTVDVGVPQLSMHSIREMCGVEDVNNAAQLLTAFYNEYSTLDACVHVDM